MNKVTIVGRLGQKPELKTYGEDKKLLSFSLATNDGYGDNKKTNWHNCTAFGKPAEIIAQYLDKGDFLAVSGSIEYNKKEDKIYTNIVVRDFSFVGGNKESNSATPKQDDAGDLPF